MGATEKMNPYEANPDNIPSTDRYADEPLYGRYFPLPSDFTPDPRFIGATTADAIEYWASVLKDCTESNRIYENQDGGRDVFALGQVIVKSSHLKEVPGGRRAHRDYSYADANEVKATAIARAALDDVKVPKIYFASKVSYPTPVVITKSSLTTAVDTWAGCPRSGENCRGWLERCLAVHLSGSEGLVQIASSKDPAQTEGG